jgi:hypothetical protein
LPPTVSETAKPLWFSPLNPGLAGEEIKNAPSATAVNPNQFDSLLKTSLPTMKTHQRSASDSLRNPASLAMKASTVFTRGLSILFASAVIFGVGVAASHAQATGDYRSISTTGNWGTAGSWERFDGTSWVTAIAAPSNTDGQINIRNGNTIAVAASTSTDQTFVDVGGQLTINASQTFTLVSTTVGTDLTISGTMLNSGAWMANGSWSANTTWTVASGGTYIHNTTGGISTPLDRATLASGSNFIYRGSSSLTPSMSLSNRTYSNLSFESSSGAWSFSLGSGSGALTTDDFTIGTNVSLNYGSFTGTTNFNGNITVSGTLGASNTANSFTVATGKQLLVNSGAAVNLASGKTLTINGSAQVTGTVGGSGTTLVSGMLSGTGTVGALTVASGGTISPGTSPGTLSAGATTFQSGGNYKLELKTDGTGTAGTEWDKLAITGTLSLGTVDPGTPFVLKLQTLTAGNANGNLASWDGSLDHTWASFITTTAGVTGFSADKFLVDTTGFLPSDFPGGFSVVLNGNNLDLQYLAIPEPSAALSLLFGTGALLTFRRWRRMA